MHLPLMAACSWGSVEWAGELLDGNADISIAEPWATVFQKARFARQKLVDKIFHPSTIMLRIQKSISYDELVVVAGLCRASSLEDVKVCAMAREPITDWNDFGRRPTSNSSGKPGIPNLPHVQDRLCGRHYGLTNGGKTNGPGTERGRSTPERGETGRRVSGGARPVQAGIPNQLDKMVPHCCEPWDFR
jgi:hypothetical protein